MIPLGQQSGTVEPSTTFRILVVDDEGLARRMMTRAIGAAGHFCSSTGSGEEAIELLELQQFDLAVIDKNLPDVSGLEVARKARGLSRKVPVIVVTGFPSSGSAHRVI
ncbi:MAG: response regulator [Deltaproteobacteria bacterium]|nr:response regulator [Deltaproteobacteria bacterium]